MRAPLVIFTLVLVVIVWQLISSASPTGSPTIPIWVVVVASASVLLSMVGGALLLAYRNRRKPPADSQDHQS